MGYLQEATSVHCCFAPIVFSLQCDFINGIAVASKHMPSEEGRLGECLNPFFVVCVKGVGF